jgi:hypothetical protein
MGLRDESLAANRLSLGTDLALPFNSVGPQQSSTSLTVIAEPEGSTPQIPRSWEPGSSLSIVSGYGLDNRTIGVRSPAEAKGFFL